MLKYLIKAFGVAAFGTVAAAAGVIAIFLFSIVGALMGAITGAIVGIVPIIGPLVKEGFVNIGIQNPNLAAIGAMLGFVGGFFKNSISPEKGWKCK